MIPMQVLADIDNARNPLQLTRERLERAATENQFMNGKIQAIDVRFPIFPCPSELTVRSRIASIWTRCSRRRSQSSRSTSLHQILAKRHKWT